MRRKPLTGYERSNRMVVRAEEVAPETDRRKAELQSTVDQKSERPRHRPPKPEATLDEKAQALGVG